MMHSCQWNLQVGQRFTSISSWEAESFELRYDNGLYILQFNVESPSKGEARRFTSEPIHIAISEVHGCLFFSFKIGLFTDWCDQAFSIHLIPKDHRRIATPTAQQVPIVFVLVDSVDGVVAALRTVYMSPHFANCLSRQLKDQLARPFDEDEHHKAVDLAYEDMPNSKMVATWAHLMERARGR